MRVVGLLVFALSLLLGGFVLRYLSGEETKYPGHGTFQAEKAAVPYYHIPKIDRSSNVQVRYLNIGVVDIGVWEKGSEDLSVQLKDRDPANVIRGNDRVQLVPAHPPGGINQ